MPTRFVCAACGAIAAAEDQAPGTTQTCRKCGGPGKVLAGSAASAPGNVAKSAARFVCPSCWKFIPVRDVSSIGAKMKCPDCHTVGTVEKVDANSAGPEKPQATAAATKSRFGFGFFALTVMAGVLLCGAGIAFLIVAWGNIGTVQAPPPGTASSAPPKPAIDAASKKPAPKQANDTTLADLERKTLNAMSDLDYDLALSIIRDAMALDRSEGGRWFALRGDAYFGKKLYMLAVDDYTVAIKQGHEKNRMFAARGRAYGEQHLYCEAAADFERAAASGRYLQEVAHASWMYARNALQRKSPEDYLECAKALCDVGVRCDPNDAQLRAVRATVLLASEGGEAEARKEWQEAVRLDPQLKNDPMAKQFAPK